MPWDVTGLASNVTYNATIESIGLSLITPNLQCLTFSTPPTPSISFKGTVEETTSLLDVYLLYANPAFSPNANISFEAIELLLYMCVKDFTPQLKNNVPAGKTVEIPMRIASNNISRLTINNRWNSHFDECVMGASLCETDSWGAMNLTTGNDLFEVGEFAGSYVSKLAYTAFAPVESRPGGNFIKNFGWRVYNFMGDVAFGYGIGLWPRPNEPSVPSEQFAIVQNITRNVAKGLEYQ
jgi:hypothetical protein